MHTRSLAELTRELQRQQELHSVEVAQLNRQLTEAAAAASATAMVADGRLGVGGDGQDALAATGVDAHEFEGLLACASLDPLPAHQCTPLMCCRHGDVCAGMGLARIDGGTVTRRTLVMLQRREEACALSLILAQGLSRLQSPLGVPPLSFALADSR